MLRGTLTGVLLATSAIFGVSSVTGASPSPKSVTITIKNFMFSPMKVTVEPGEKIKVVNKDTVTHTLTATGGQFDSGNVGHNATKTFRAPTKRGTYDYICSIHQYMTGEIVVK
ncbi:MAG: cupredoxin domain-containing protein [Acidimicrobiales bacterium]|jgi:plastocyanin